MYPLSLQYLVTARIFLLTAGMLTSRRQEKPYSSLCLSYGFIYVHCIVPSVCEHWRSRCFEEVGDKGSSVGCEYMESCNTTH